MKAVAGFALVALASQALATPAGWEDAGKVSTTTTTEDPKTWEDVPASSTATTTTTDPGHTWEDVPASSTATTTTDPGHTWEDVPAESTTTPAASHTWGDVPDVWTTTVTDTIVTYCSVPTTFTHGPDVYTVTEATTLTLTKGPYTVSIPVYEETSTVCEEEATKTPVAGGPAGPTGKPVSPVGGAKPSASGYPGGKPELPTSDEEVDVYTGSASKMAGAGLAGVAAIAALLL